MACPEESTLNSFCIGGQLAQHCADADGNFPEIQVIVRLINPAGGYVCDPTTGAMLIGDLVYNSANAGPPGPDGEPGPAFPEGNDGCWCTCPLYPNIASGGDPNAALQPQGTYYSISIIAGGALIGGAPFVVQLDADGSYPTVGSSCGTCIPIKELLDPLPTIPPPPTFCDAVQACLDPINVNDGAYGVFRPATSSDILLTELNIGDGTAADPDAHTPVIKLANGQLAVPTPVIVIPEVNDGAYGNSAPYTNQILLHEGNVADGTAEDPDDYTDVVKLNTGGLGVPTPPPGVVPDVNDGAFGNSVPYTNEILLHEGNITDGTAADPAVHMRVTKLSDGGLGVPMPPEGVMPVVNNGAFGNSTPYTNQILLHEANIADGTTVDASTTVPVYKLDDGTLGVQAGDPCDALQGDPLPCDPALSVYATDGTECGPIAFKDIAPKHGFGSCTTACETIPAVGTGNSQEIDLSMTELERGQLGSLVANPDSAIWPTVNATGGLPLNITVPPHNPNCVLALHVSYGGDPLDGFTWSHSGANVGNATSVVDTQQLPTSSIGAAVLFFDPTNGAGGDTVTLDWSVLNYNGTPPPPDSNDAGNVIQWYWNEICNTVPGGTLSVSDFDLGNIATNSIDGLDTSDEIGTSEPIDMGDCPSVYFATGRHVSSFNGFQNPPLLNQDADWFTISNGSETYDTASSDDDYFAAPGDDGSCQAGSASGVIPGGSGPTTWTYETNAMWLSGRLDAAFLHAITLAECEPVDEQPEVMATETCTVEAPNPNCACAGVMRCSVNGAVQICVDDLDNSTIAVVPVVNGVDYVPGTVAVTTQGMTGTQFCQTVPMSFEITDLANVIPPNGTASATFEWKIIGATGVVKLGEMTTTCEVIHI